MSPSGEDRRDRELLLAALRDAEQDQRNHAEGGDEELAAFEADRPAPGDPADFATAAAWRDFETRLGAEPAPARRPTELERPWLPWAAAALLLMVSLALAWQVAQISRRGVELARQVEELSAPRANVPLVYLDAVTRSEEDGGAVPEGWEGRFVLVVTPDAPAPFPDYRVEVRDEDGRALATVGGLTLSDHGTLRLSLPGLPAGEHRVTVWGLPADGEPVAAGEHRLRVR